MLLGSYIATRFLSYISTTMRLQLHPGEANLYLDLLLWGLILLHIYLQSVEEEGTQVTMESTHKLLILQLALVEACIQVLEESPI